MRALLFTLLLATLSFAQTETHEFYSQTSTGKCPDGRELTLDECENMATDFSSWGGSGLYDAPESCGCYVDDNTGDRFFNTNTDEVDCSQFDAGELVICKRLVVVTDEPTTSPTFQPSNLPSATPTEVEDEDASVSGAEESDPEPESTVLLTFLEPYSCVVGRISSSELNFFDHDGNELDWDLTSVIGDDSPDNEGPDNLNDDDSSTKWLSFFTCGETIDLEAAIYGVPYSYSFTTSNDGQLRDPAKWSITVCCGDCGDVVEESYYSEDHPRLTDTALFYLSGCPSVPSATPAIVPTGRPTLIPSTTPLTQAPVASPTTRGPSKSPVEMPSAAPVVVPPPVEWTWECDSLDLPFGCYEDEHEMLCIETDEDGFDYCCEYINNGDDFCCVDRSETLTECYYLEDTCELNCEVDGLTRNCEKDCPVVTDAPSQMPTQLCRDNDVVLDSDGVIIPGQTCEIAVSIVLLVDSDCHEGLVAQCARSCDACTEIPTLTPTDEPSQSPEEMPPPTVTPTISYPSGSPVKEPSSSPHEKCRDNDFVVDLDGEIIPGQTCETVVRVLDGAHCAEELSIQCQESCPNACTEWPSRYPTTQPSFNPSGYPSEAPVTSDPSAMPSISPHDAPTNEPSMDPSATPTQECMDNPFVVDTNGSDDPFDWEIIPHTNCVTATAVLDLNIDECGYNLAWQCQFSCNICNPPTVSPTRSPPSSTPTKTPSNLPSASPTILCEDADVVVDSNGVAIEGTTCYSAWLVGELNDTPCEELILWQCPAACGLCSYSPTESPTISEPTMSPETTEPSNMPSMTPVPQPSAAPQLPMPTEAPFVLFDCGNTIEECNESYLAYEGTVGDCNDDLSGCEHNLNTVTGVLSSTSADLETANSDLQAANADVATCNEDLNTANDLVSSCEESLDALQVVTEVSTLQSGLICTTPDDWLFNTVAADATVPENHVLCVLENQYAVRNEENGNVYPMCVGYDSESSTACDVETLVCGDEDNQIMGWAGQQSSRVDVALMRADFKHCDCPSIQAGCAPLSGWWQDRIVDQSSATPEQAANVCVNTETSELRIVTADAWMNTCVGFSENPIDQCNNDRHFICSSMDDGYTTYGYPAQISRSVGRAIEAEGYRHPQCPF